jgi:hypothetical protein
VASLYYLATNCILNHNWGQFCFLIQHGTIGSSNFWQLELALFSKHIILKKALEYEEIAQML